MLEGDIVRMGKKEAIPQNNDNGFLANYLIVMWTHTTKELSAIFSDSKVPQ